MTQEVQKASKPKASSTLFILSILSFLAMLVTFQSSYALSAVFGALTGFFWATGAVIEMKRKRQTR